MILDEQQQDVINEYLREAIDKLKRNDNLNMISLEDRKHRTLYTNRYGTDAPLFLTIYYIVHLKQDGHPAYDELIELLESVIPKAWLSEWLTETQYLLKHGPVDFIKIGFDGQGYYKIGDIRVDADDFADHFKEARNLFNSWKGNVI